MGFIEFSYVFLFINLTEKGSDYYLLLFIIMHIENDIYLLKK